MSKDDPCPFVSYQLTRTDAEVAAADPVRRSWGRKKGASHDQGGTHEDVRCASQPPPHVTFCILSFLFFFFTSLLVGSYLTDREDAVRVDRVWDSSPAWRGCTVLWALAFGVQAGEKRVLECKVR